MCCSRKFPYPRGVSKDHFFKGKYGTKMEFPKGVGGGGAHQKTFHGRGMDIFWNNTIWSTNTIFTTKSQVILVPGPIVHHNEKSVSHGR